MKLLKLTDLVMQLLITTAALLCLIFINDGCGIFYFYFALGGWQVASFVTHLFITESWKSSIDRSNYGKTLFWTALIGLLNYLLLLVQVPLILFYLLALLVISPVMAIWYFLIGFHEWENLKNRELIHLK
jgi:hypothetical protein